MILRLYNITLHEFTPPQYKQRALWKALISHRKYKNDSEYCAKNSFNIT